MVALDLVNLQTAGSVFVPPTARIFQPAQTFLAGAEQQNLFWIGAQAVMILRRRTCPAHSLHCGRKKQKIDSVFQALAIPSSPSLRISDFLCSGKRKKTFHDRF